jgi:hypothetical protein
VIHPRTIRVLCQSCTYAWMADVPEKNPREFCLGIACPCGETSLRAFSVRPKDAILLRAIFRYEGMHETERIACV